MKDLFLIPLMLAMLVFGYYIVTRVDIFIDENQRLLTDGVRNGLSRVRIAAENSALLGSVAPALESCSNADPHISFFLSSGRSEHLLEKLLEERVDIVLLPGDSPSLPEGPYATLLIPREQAAPAPSFLGLPIDSEDEDLWLRVVWNRDLPSKDRDRVIFALENEHCGVKCGYADYLDRQN